MRGGRGRIVWRAGVERDVKGSCGGTGTGRRRSARERSAHRRSVRESLAWLPPGRDERARPAVSGTEAAGVVGPLGPSLPGSRGSWVGAARTLLSLKLTIF